MRFRRSLLNMGMACLFSLPVTAEVVFTDGVSTLTGDITINDSQGVTQGSNLLHSFQTFNIQTGESVNFTGPDAINNIIARVTGNQSSEINGVLKSSIVGANLFLLNPNGIMFGSGAAIDIDGGLYLTTANSVLFEDGSQLLVSDSGASGFTTAAPSAFGFTVKPGDISFDAVNISTPQLSGGNFATAPVNKLVLIGGNILLDDTNINLRNTDFDVVSLGGIGNVPLSTPRALADGQVLGSITIMGNSQGGSVALNSSGERAGNISILADSLKLADNAVIFSDSQGQEKGRGIDVVLSGLLDMSSGARITTDASSVGAGGDLNINAANIIMNGRSTNISSNNFSVSGGSGAVDISAQSIDLSENAQISSVTIGATSESAINIQSATLNVYGGASISGTTQGFGNGKDINISATEALTLRGEGSGIFSSTQSRSGGSAGAISIAAGAVSVSDKSSVNAASRLFLSGAPGNITFDVDTLIVESLGEISTSNASDNAAGGTVTIRAENLVLMGSDAINPQLVYSTISSSTSGGAGGGNVEITATNTQISDGGVIDVLTNSAGAAGSVSVVGNLSLDQGRIDARTFGVGNGGEIVLMGNISLSNSGRVDTSTPIDFVGVGDAGAISVSGPSLIVSGAGSSIASSTQGEGAAGTININSTLVELIDGGSIDTSSVSLQDTAGDAGSIAVLSGSVSVVGEGSTLASLTLGPGAAGNVNITADQVVLSQAGSIDTSTLSNGAAGSILIDAARFFVTGEGTKASSSTQGSASGGDIVIATNDLTIAQDAVVTVTANSTGDAGSISLVARNNFEVLDGGKVETNAALSGGGNVNIDVINRIYLRDSTIAASSGGPEVGADGGNIYIDPILFILDNSRIVAQAVAGNGGTINLFADNFVIDYYSTISATSELGNDGEVIVASPDTSVTGTIGALVSGLVSDDALLSEPCAARLLENRSSLVIGRGDQMLAVPGDYGVASRVSCSGRN
jgi:filamentous hemagglutinin family protein